IGRTPSVIRPVSCLGSSRSLLCGAGCGAGVEPGLRPGIGVEPGLRPGFLCFEIVWCRVSDPAFFFEIVWCRVSDPAFFFEIVWCRVSDPAFFFEIVWCRVSDPAFFFEIVWCRVSDPAFFGRQSCFDTLSQRNVPPNTRQLKSSREAETSSTGLCGAGSPTRPRDSALRVEHKYSYRRRLPHLQKDARPIFVTFTTHHRWVLPPLARDAVLECCLAVHEKLCNLHAAVVMPDHVHLLLTAGRSADG